MKLVDIFCGSIVVSIILSIGYISTVLVFSIWSILYIGNYGM